MGMNDPTYSVLHATPSASAYDTLRTGAGLSAKTAEAASQAIAILRTLRERAVPNPSAA
jgi:hypothetical protein